ncbi:MAG: rhomboid family intramembrane serine protease [Planctomycetota bacterium]|nr:rhomboid family intramembrane serine protease [Planctomycetota bacterium]
MPSRSPANMLEAAPITCANLAGCICFFVYSVVASSTVHSLDGHTGGLMRVDLETLVRLGASQHEGLWDGQWQRLVLPMFLHGGLMHIVMNMMCLWYMGPSAEVHFGSSNYGSIYYMSGIGGICLSMLFGGNVSVGASGCIFGIEGAYLAVLIMQNARWTTAYRSADVRRTALMIAILYFALMLGARTDNWAHLGGLVFGTLYGMLFEYWRKHQRVGLALLLSMVLVSAGLIAAARWTFFDPWYYVHAGLRAEDRSRGDEAQARFDDARACAERWWPSRRAGLELIERAQHATVANDPHAAARYLSLAVAVSPADVAEHARGLIGVLAYLNQPEPPRRHGADPDEKTKPGDAETGKNSSDPPEPAEPKNP